MRSTNGQRRTMAPLQLPEVVTDSKSYMDVSEILQKNTGKMGKNRDLGR